MKNRRKDRWALVRRLSRSVVASHFAVWLCVAQEPVLSLEGAVTLAKRQNAQIQIANLDVTKAVEETSQAKTQRLPVFKVYANVGESLTPINLSIPMGALGEFPATGPVPAQDAAIKTPRQIAGFIYGTAGQPLSQLYKAGLGVREARIGEEAARERARQQIRETTQQVRQSYYQLTQTQSQMAAAQISLKYLEELSVYTERNLARETVLKSDMLNVAAKLSQQRYQLVTLADYFATQKEALNHLLGRDLRTGFTIEPEPPPSEDEVSLPVAQHKARISGPKCGRPGYNRERRSWTYARNARNISQI